MVTDPCPFCSKRFASLDFLSSHIERRHHDEPYATRLLGPNSGVLEDSEGEIRTSRLERQRTMWSPNTEAEREMTGARGFSDVRRAMRIERAKEHSSGSWPVVAGTTAGASKGPPDESASKSFEALSGRQNRHERSHVSQKRHTRALRPDSPSQDFSLTDNGSRRVLNHKAAQTLGILPRNAVKNRHFIYNATSMEEPSIGLATESSRNGHHTQQASEEAYVACPLEECGEQVLSTEIVDHIERHQAEQLVLEGDDPSLDSIRPLSLPADTLSQSSPTIIIQDRSEHSHSESGRANEPELPAYRAASGSEHLAGHSYYAPEKSEPVRVDSPVNQVLHHNLYHPGTPSVQVQSRIVCDPSSAVAQGVSTRRDSIPATTYRIRETRAHQSTTDSIARNQSNNHRRLLSNNAVAQNQQRPKSAMAVLYKAGNENVDVRVGIAKHARESTVVRTPISQPNGSVSRPKRQSYIESAISEVKDRVSSLSIASTVDGLERRLRASRERSEAGQLSKQALGPYALEKEMPAWLYRQLQRGPRVYRHKTRGRDGRTYIEEIVENETPGIVSMLARLSELDASVGRAYFCHPATTHISKIRGEGGFCGYRNIQMQISYLRGAEAEGHSAFPKYRTPGVLELQDMIESAWDAGHFASSRQEVGKLRGTRKWIGTSEAHALFKHQNIECEARMFLDDAVEGRMAFENLFVWMESYFRANLERLESGSKGIHRTLVPPVYLQFPGHSVTVVGYEVHKEGQRSLLVLDPMYITSRAMDQFLDVGPRRIRRSRNEILQVYRRYEADFRNYACIEVLFLSRPAPRTPAWDVRYPILRLQR